MRRQKTKTQRIAMWVLSVLVVLSMLCALLASVLPRGASEGSLLMQWPLAQIIELGWLLAA